MIITLCGSTRDEFKYHWWNKHLTLLGHCVYSLSVFPSSESEPEWYTPEQKSILILVHLRKISNSDAILVVGAAGEYTDKEILWARIGGKRVLFADSLSAQDEIDLGTKA